MQKHVELLAQLGFNNTCDVSERTSIADLVQPTERCGIYVLHFGNGEFYVGQAVNVCRRYVQHTMTHTDIEKISFKCVSPEKLSDEEKRIIWTFEKSGARLRNIIHTSTTFAPSAFDEVVTPDEQQKWLTNLDNVDFVGERLDNPEVRRKYTAKYDKFKQLPHAEDVTAILREYVRVGIPAPIRSEYYYWSCSCLPGDSRNFYARININQQEAFAILVTSHQIVCICQLAHSPIQDGYGKWLSYPRVFAKYKAAMLPIRYKAGGQDQIRVQVQGTNNILGLLRDPHVIRAARLFNLRLMRKGINLFFRYHCFDLADDLLQQTVSKP